MSDLRLLDSTQDEVRPSPVGNSTPALLADFHNRTILFRAGNLIFVTYGLLAGGAFFLGFSHGLWYDALSGQNVSAKSWFYLLGMLLAVLVGARWCSVLLEWRHVFRRPW